MVFFCIECEKLFSEEFGYFDFTNLFSGLGHLNGYFLRFGHHVVNKLDDEKEGSEEGLGGIFGEAVDRFSVDSFPDRGPEKLNVFDNFHKFLLIIV